VIYLKYQRLRTCGDALCYIQKQSEKVPARKEQQKPLWTAVQEVTRRCKGRFKISELVADERCTRAVLDFLATMDVGRTVPPGEKEEERSEASECEREDVRCSAHKKKNGWWGGS